MTLLGEWNWYLPSWLSWLPELHVEGDPEPTAGLPPPPRRLHSFAALYLKAVFATVWQD